MKKLDKYFVLELLRMIVLSLLVAELVLLLLQAIRLSGFIINQGLELSLIARMIFGLAMSFLPIVLPIAFLFSLLIVFGRMATDLEFLALQAMGRSPRRLLVPGLWVGAFMALMSLWVSFYLGPLGNRNFEIAVDTAWRKKVTSVLRAGTFSEGFLNMVIFVDQIDPISQELRRVFLYDEKSFRESSAISASRGRWIQDSQSGLGVLRLYDGQIITQNHESDRLQRIRFDEYSIYADFRTELAGSRNSPASQSWDNLIEKRKALMSDPNADARSVWMEIARRIAVSFACLLFLPLCFAIALDNRRTAKNRAVFSGLVIVLVYWTLYFGIASGFQRANVSIFKQYEILSWFAIFIPNFLILGVGLWLFRKRSRLAQD
jgi:lipopolysaccharide export system permease protein